MQKSPKPSPLTPSPKNSSRIARTAPQAMPATSQPTRTFIKRTERWLWLSALPPVLFVGVALSLRNPQPPEGAPDASAPDSVTLTSRGKAPVTVLMAKETMVTSLKPIGGFALLNGELQPAIQVRGEAPIGGRVTDVLVKPGQRVTVGDPILRVEGKVKAPGSQAALRKQSAAEAEQVAAARQQEKLQSKLATRQEKLLAAQQRVAQAQQRVAQARAVVSRLTKGERITRSEVAALATPELSTRLAARGSVATRRAETREAALRDSQKASALVAWRTAKKEAEQARREADLAVTSSSEAKREAQSAAKDAAAKKQAVKDAQAQLAKLQGEALEEARTALAKAQVAAQDAETRASDLQKAAILADSKSERQRKVSTEADQRLAKLPDPASFNAPAPTPRSEEKTPAVTEALSANDVMKLAEAAVDESKQAAAEAERLKDEIDSYARQVKTLHATLNSTSEKLESAQMSVVESKIAEKLEAVRAPATGVVLDIATTASDVSPGETIIAIGRPDRLEVRFEDTSDAWKTLKVGTQLPAAIEEGDKKTSILAELQEIKEPKNGAAAVLITAIDNPRQANGGRRFRSGLTVQCSIPRPGARESLSIPSAALWRDSADQPLVAVLIPTKQDAQPASLAEPQQNPSALPAPTTETTPVSTVGTFRVEWRAVTTGQGDALQQEIAGGLQPGERIALRPAPLRALTEKHGVNALVQLSA